MNQFVLANVVTYLLIHFLYYYFKAINGTTFPIFFDAGLLSYCFNNINYYDTIVDVKTECLFSSDCNSIAFNGFDIVLKYKAAFNFLSL